VTIQCELLSEMHDKYGILYEIPIRTGLASYTYWSFNEI